MFEEAEAAIYTLQVKVAELSATTDISVLVNEIEALKAEVRELDSRLDAIAGAAADPT